MSKSNVNTMIRKLVTEKLMGRRFRKRSDGTSLSSHLWVKIRPDWVEEYAQYREGREKSRRGAGDWTGSARLRTPSAKRGNKIEEVDYKKNNTRARVQNRSDLFLSVGLNLDDNKPADEWLDAYEACEPNMMAQLSRIKPHNLLYAAEEIEGLVADYPNGMAIELLWRAFEGHYNGKEPETVRQAALYCHKMAEGKVSRRLDGETYDYRPNGYPE